MPSKKNKDQVNTLVNELNTSGGVIFIDHQGMKSAQMEALRNSLEEIGANLQVTKSTLLHVALTKSKYPTSQNDDTFDSAFTGPISTITLAEEVLAPIKTLVDFVTQNEMPRIKLGYVAEELTSADRIQLIAKIPPREVLISTLLRQLNAPAQNLVYALNGTAAKLIYALFAIQEKKALSTQPKGGDGNGEN